MTSLLLLASLAAGWVAPPTGAAFIQDTMTIDGQFDDWIGIRRDLDNIVVDSQIPDDPDWPGQPDRDVYLVAATYDEEYLYLSWRRTAGGQKTITFGAYLDYQGDGLLQDGDKAVLFTVSSGAPYASYDNGSAWILDYHQARKLDGSLYHPLGDPMRDVHRLGDETGDGETPDGWVTRQGGQSIPALPMEAYLSPDGIECEARIAWSDLGVDPYHAFALHFAAGNGTSWGGATPSTTYKDIGGGRYLEENRGSVEDNIEPILYLVNRSVAVEPDNAGGGAAETTVTYTHTITNTGNSDDVYDLSVISSRVGWTVVMTDASGNATDAVALAAGESITVKVLVGIPDGATPGMLQTTTLTATSRADPTVTDSAIDTTRVGLITVTPDRAASMAPGGWVDYVFTVQNNRSETSTVDLTTGSSLGWTNEIFDESGPLSSLVLAPDEQHQVTVRVHVDDTARTGDQDVTWLQATLRGYPWVRGRAIATTTVMEGLSIVASQTGYSGSGTFIEYQHTITNSWPTTRTVSISALSSAGWDVRIYEANGVDEITDGTVEVGPWGATLDVIVRLFIPAGANTGDEDLTTVTVSAAGSEPDSVGDRTIVRQLACYLDTGYLNASDHYVLGDTVYGRATGLKPGDYVYFVWLDAGGNEVRRSSLRKVDTQGMAFDEHLTEVGEQIGTGWLLTLYSDRDAPLETYLFSVSFDAEITQLSATDAPGVGQETAVTSSVVNRNTVEIASSSIAYVIWWDSDADGVFSAGDTYIAADGSPAVWDGVSTVVTHETTGVTVPAGGTWNEAAPWTIANTQFPNQGTYRVTATWFDQTGGVIDTATTEFYSIPALGWPIAALTVLGAAIVLWRRRPAAGGDAA